MPRSAEDIPQVVFSCFFDIFGLRHPMIILAVHTLCAGSTSVINAEVGGAFLLKVICFSEACVDLRLKLG